MTDNIVPAADTGLPIPASNAAPVDPIFAAIGKHKIAGEVYQSLILRCDKADASTVPAADKAALYKASDAHDDALAEFVATVPQTPAGVLAFMLHALSTNGECIVLPGGGDAELKTVLGTLIKSPIFAANTVPVPVAGIGLPSTCPVAALAAAAQNLTIAVQAAAAVDGPLLDRLRGAREFDLLEDRLRDVVDSATELRTASPDGALFQLVVMRDRLQIICDNHDVDAERELEMRMLIYSLANWLRTEAKATIGDELWDRYMGPDPHIDADKARAA